MAKDIVIIPASGEIHFSGSTHDNIMSVDLDKIKVQTSEFKIVGGDIVAENYIVSSSVTHMTTSFSTGNTAFGNTYTDTHQFFGKASIGEYKLVPPSVANNFADLLVLSGSGPSGMTILTGPANSGQIYFADAESGDGQKAGQIEYHHAHNRFTFVTNNTDALTIDSSQNSTFVGDISASKNLIVGNKDSTYFSASAGNVEVSGSGQANLIVDGNISGSAGHTGSFSNILLPNTGYIGSPAHPDAVQFGFAGLDTMQVKAGGFYFSADTTVGVLGDHLEVGQDIKHTGDTSTKISFTNDNIKLYANGNELLEVSGGAQNAIYVGKLATDQDFVVRSAPSNYAINVIGSTANVGIGTNNPTKKLQVEGDISASGDLYIQSGKSIHFADEVGGHNDHHIRHSTDSLIISGTTDNVMAINTKMGRVGIGKAVPSKALEVAGDISASGHLYLQSTKKAYLNPAEDTYLDSDSTDRVRVVAGGHQMMVWDYDTGQRAVFGNGTKVYIGANDNYQPTKELVVAGDISASGHYHGQKFYVRAYSYVRTGTANTYYESMTPGSPQADTTGFGTANTSSLGYDNVMDGVDFIAHAPCTIEGYKGIGRSTVGETIQVTIWKGSLVNASNAGIALTEVAEYSQACSANTNYFFSGSITSNNTLAENDFVMTTIKKSTDNGTAYIYVNGNLELKYT